MAINAQGAAAGNSRPSLAPLRDNDTKLYDIMVALKKQVEALPKHQQPAPTVFDELNKQLEKYLDVAASPEGESKGDLLFAKYLAHFKIEDIENNLFEPIFKLVDSWVNDSMFDISDPTAQGKNRELIEKELGVYITGKLEYSLAVFSNALIFNQNKTGAVVTATTNAPAAAATDGATAAVDDTKKALSELQYSTRSLLKNAHDKLFVAKYRAPILQHFIQIGFKQQAITSVIQRFPWSLFEINNRDDSKATVFHWSILSHNKEISDGANPNLPNLVLNLLLDSLAKFCHEKNVPKRFLDAMMLQNVDRMTPLDFALWNNRPVNVKLIITRFLTTPTIKDYLLKNVPNWPDKILSFVHFKKAITDGCADSITELLKYEGFSKYASVVLDGTNETPLRWSIYCAVSARRSLVQMAGEQRCETPDFQQPHVLLDLSNRLRLAWALIDLGKADPHNPTAPESDGLTARDIFNHYLNIDAFRDLLQEWKGIGLIAAPAENPTLTQIEEAEIAKQKKEKSAQILELLNKLNGKFNPE